MKLRYQLRGLGIGMVLTALLMGVSARNGSSMSDAEIRARALELGMVEGDSLKLTDIVPTRQPDSDGVQSSNPGGMSTQMPPSNAGEVPTQASSSNAGEVPTQASSSNDGGVSLQTPLPNADGASGQVSSSNPGEVPSQTLPSNAGGGSMPVSSSNAGGENSITIVITKGEIASEICAKLAEAGAIEDAAAFETYLCGNNWSRSIRDGSYDIPLGTSMEDIARIITGNP